MKETDLTVELNSMELLEAVSDFLRKRGKLLLAVGGQVVGNERGDFVFLTTPLTDEVKAYEAETKAEVTKLLKEHRLIDAIKYHRGRTGGGLVESKYHVENLKRTLGL
jgi:ribosomal protein L7/L12